METRSGPLKTIVLLPGLFAGDWIWKPTRDDLEAGGHRVFTIAEPLAAIGTLANSLDNLRTAVIGLLDNNNLSSAILCGNSLGALVALDAAYRHPNRVEALILSGCPGLGDAGNWGISSRPGAAEIAAKMFFDPNAIPAALVEESVSKILNRRCAANIIRYLIAIREFNVPQAMAGIHCGLQLIWGENDRIAPVAAWLAHIANKELIQIIPQCGHAPMIEKPAEFNAILTAYLLTVARP